MKKYQTHRDDIHVGDIILFRGDAFISKAIRWLDNAPYNHAAIVFEANGRKFIMESTRHGVNPRLLSVAIKQEKYTDFCIIRPKSWSSDDVSIALTKAFKSAEKGIGYDFKLMLQIAIKRLTNTDVDWASKRQDICSEYAQRYTKKFENPKADNYESPPMPNKFITPWDFVIYAKPHFDVLFNKYQVGDPDIRSRHLMPI